jgi:hypothetical protein
MPRKTATSAKRVKSDQLRQRVLELRRRGMTIRSIADEVGKSSTRVHQVLLAALQKIAEETEVEVRELRILENDRLDRALQAIWPGVEAGDLKAIDRLIRIIDRRSKLFGLDTPTKSIPTNAEEEAGYSGLSNLLAAYRHKDALGRTTG